jgi:hypothetical protein
MANRSSGNCSPQVLGRGDFDRVSSALQVGDAMSILFGPIELIAPKCRRQSTKTLKSAGQLPGSDYYSGKFIFFRNALYRGSPSIFLNIASPLISGSMPLSFCA